MSMMNKFQKLLRDPLYPFRNDYARYCRLPPEAYEKELKKWYWRQTGERLDLENPKTFNEKIQWLKLYDNTPLKTRLADKYLVREYVEEKIGKEYLIPLLGVYDSFDEIDFQTLPDRFVLKANHGSGWNIIVKDKAKLDIEEARKKFNSWMKTNFAFKAGFELQYKNILPRIIIEQYMEDKSNCELKDYKYFTFNGVAKLMFIASERQILGEETKFDFFDMSFNHLDFTNGHPNSKIMPKKPENFDLMKQLAEMLSQNIPQVRVDFYEADGRVYFGEMTFTHWSGAVLFDPPEWDCLLGSWIELPKANR